MPIPTPASAAHGGSDAVDFHFIPQTPPLDPREIDSAEAALEIVLLWGDQSILHVEHLSPPRAYYVGEAPESDFQMGSESLGLERLPIVIEHGSRIALVIAAGATGEIAIDDQRVSFEELAAQGLLQPAAEPAGAQLYPLPLGATARMSYRGFSFLVKPGAAARRVGAWQPRELRNQLWTLASMLLHGGLLLSFYFLPPRSSALSLDLLNADSRLVAYLSEPREFLDEPEPVWLHDDTDAANGGTGERHSGDDGQLGKQDAQKTKNKYAVQGPRDNPEPRLPPRPTSVMAASAGIIGVLRSSLPSNAPSSVFSHDAAQGNDAEGAIGALFGDQTGANFGLGGLGMRGSGRGGGGTGDGSVGQGKLGTLGHGDGAGTGDGYGHGAGSFHGRVARVPRVRSGQADVHGSLSKEVIRRVIGRHVSEVRYCYEQQLNARPDLQGRITVKFMIAPTGEVRVAALDGSDLGDPRVEQCIVSAVRRWVFPAPEAGVVVVSYPFLLSQAGN